MVPRRTWGFSSSETLYLTFDDGPTPDLTSWILDLLKEKEIKASFFCVGSNAKKYPELMNRMVQEGHVIGNHTMKHENGNKTSKEDYLNSIQEAAKYIDSNLFRPPYGRLPVPYVSSIRKEYEIIMWTWLSYDFDENVSVDEILIKSQKQIKGGDILVLHDNLKIEAKIKELLPIFLDDLIARGYQFDVISSFS